MAIKTNPDTFHNNNKGYLCLVLHAHLPYIRHPEHEYFLEENWLYEAITESYIPLIKVFDSLTNDEINFKITMTLSPTLTAMLLDPLLQSRYIRHIDNLIELSEKEIKRTFNNHELNMLAKMYNNRFLEARELFVNTYKNNLIDAFKKFQNHGKLEIITSAATHGYLPLMQNNYKAVKAQIQVAVDYYKSIFGAKPIGFWLPECGFYTGLDQILQDAGIRYFFVDTHSIINASTQPKYGVHAPVYCSSGVAAFGRDKESSKQVWSATEGYPGDFSYREFYSDIGHELEYEYIKPYIHPDGIRIDTGIKYYRITGKTKHKELYIPDNADKTADNHAENFMFNKARQIEYIASSMDRKPIVVAPYDAELFGHWWFEGPLWLDYLIRKINSNQNEIRLITPSEYLKEYPVNQIAEPSASSWGYNGYNEVWLNDTNDWIYKHLHIVAARMNKLADNFKNENGIIKRALNQASREILLAQSSDWAFIMNTGTFAEYAKKRVNEHITRFNRLYKEVLERKIDEEWLSKIEAERNIFPDIDFRVFA